MSLKAGVMDWMGRIYVGNLLMHYQTHFFHGGDKLKKSGGEHGGGCLL